VIFSLPWAFLGLAALPALAAIYLLRSRSQRRPVSSLLLWSEFTRPHAGGRVLKRLHLPLLLAIELLAIALLVTASTGPEVSAGRTQPPLAVVLDDSFSMQAGGEESPRRRAVRDLVERLQGEPATAVRFILARTEPRALGTRFRGAARGRELLEQWTCRSAAADLEAAVTHARDTGGPRTRILVLTDRPPATEPGEGRIVWQAFGEPRPNAAIVQAGRSRRETSERCLLEVANFADRPDTLRVTVDIDPADAAAAAPAPLVRRVRLGAGERKPLLFELPDGAGIVRARLEPDALPADDRIVLLPDPRRRVRVALRLGDEALRAAVARGLESSGRARLTGRAPDLLVTDGPPAADASPDLWSACFRVDEEAEAFVGPFITDPTHPLCAGLNLRSVVWAARREPPLPGAPVIAAGSVPLVTDTRRFDGRHEIRLRLAPDRSNLTQSTNWPVLLWNLLEYRAADLPGPPRPNVRLGSVVSVPLPRDTERVEVRPPDGEAFGRPVSDDRAVVPAETCGIWEVRAGGWACRLAVNALEPAESDLRGADTGRWGAWRSGPAVVARQPVAWLAILAAAGLLVLHLGLAGRPRREAAP
jgi:hypothetical protein